MALELKVIGILEDTDVAWVQDPVPWWPVRSLTKDVRFRVVERNAAYRDFVAVLTPSEAVSLADEYATNAHDRQKADAELLRNRILQSTWIVLNVFEWG